MTDFWRKATIADVFAAAAGDARLPQVIDIESPAQSGTAPGPWWEPTYAMTVDDSPVEPIAKCTGPCTPVEITGHGTVGSGSNKDEADKLKKDKEKVKAAVKAATDDWKAKERPDPKCPIEGCGCGNIFEFPTPPFGPVCTFKHTDMGFFVILGVHCTSWRYGKCIEAVSA